MKVLLISLVLGSVACASIPQKKVVAKPSPSPIRKVPVVAPHLAVTYIENNYYCGGNHESK